MHCFKAPALITDWEQESARKLKMMTTNIFKIRNAITAFTNHVGFDFTFGKKGVTDTQEWIRNGPHHSTVIKNVIGRMLNGMNFLSEVYGNNTKGKKDMKIIFFPRKKFYERLFSIFSVMAMMLMVIDSMVKHDSLICNSIMDREDGGISLSAYYKYQRLRPTEFERKIVQDLDEATSYSIYEKPTIPLEKQERLRRLNAVHQLTEDYPKVRDGSSIIYNRALRNQFHQRILERMDRERPRIQGKNLKYLEKSSYFYLYISKKLGIIRHPELMEARDYLTPERLPERRSPMMVDSPRSPPRDPRRRTTRGLTQYPAASSRSRARRDDDEVQIISTRNFQWADSNQME